MGMKFETNDRPDRSLQHNLNNEITPFSQVPFPKSTDENNVITEPYENYVEILASERFKEICENFKKYCGNTTITPTMVMPFTIAMGQSHYNIINIERDHREELEKLAVDLVLSEMGIPKGSFIFDVKIINQDEFDTEDFEHGEIPPKSEEVNIDKEPPSNIDKNIVSDEIEGNDFHTEQSEENLEMVKRRLINSIIQGASERGHYMFHLVEDKLREITGNNDIIKYYGIMMSINDTMYWELSDDIVKMMGGGEGGDGSVAGKESVDRNTTPPTIHVRSINFPALVHEIIKGIMEVFAIHGLPENYENFKNETDTLELEMWDLRLGPSIWKKLRSSFPEEILTGDDVELQNFLITEIFKIPAKSFLQFMREIFKGSDESKRMMNILMRKVYKNRENEEDFDNENE